MIKENDMTYSITLDISSDTTLGELDDTLTRYNLSISHYLPLGPGGGNPEITFITDSLDNIRNFLSSYCDSDDLDFYLQGVIAK
jgi:hypothetical protein